MSEDLMRAEEMYNAVKEKEKEEQFNSRRWAVIGYLGIILGYYFNL